MDCLFRALFTGTRHGPENSLRQCDVNGDLSYNCPLLQSILNLYIISGGGKGKGGRPRAALCKGQHSRVRGTKIWNFGVCIAMCIYS